MWGRTEPSRREFLGRAGTGFGLVALADLLAGESSRGAAPGSDRSANPYAVRAPHHAPRAKRCLFLYMPGGPSHIDLFDPKPKVAAMDGRPLPFEIRTFRELLMIFGVCRSVGVIDRMIASTCFIRFGSICPTGTP